MPHRAPLTASIVELSAFRRRPGALERPRHGGAELLSLRRSLEHEASVEIDGLDALAERYGELTLSGATRRVRTLLDREFGHLRVYRARRRFVVRHRSSETLIAGLLRVQFHARAVRLPEVDLNGEPVERRGLAITWGVGRSAPEAELERLRRRRRKLQR